MKALVSTVLFATAVLLAGVSAGPRGDSASAAAPAPVVPGAAAAFDPAWAEDPLWDDGRAEVSLYEARRPQYGKIESYEALFIVVKEDFGTRHYVKADPPYEGKPLLAVLKLNAVHSYWTPNYPYHFLASVFVRRDDPATLVKLTVGSQEWCGNTFKEVKTWGGRPELVFHSYFDGQGDGSRPLDLRPGDLLEDQLPLALRGLRFAPGLELRRRLLPSLISNNLRAPGDMLEATIRVAGEEKISTPAGRFDSWKVTLQMGDLVQNWWFERDAPHALLKMESSDGRSWLLKARTRKPYWQTPTFSPEM